MQAARHVAQDVEPAHPARQLQGLGVLEDDFQELVDPAFLHLEGAVHVTLADAETGIEGDGALGSPIRDANDDPAAGAIAEAMQIALAVIDPQITLADDPIERDAKWTEHDDAVRYAPRWVPGPHAPYSETRT